MGCLDVSLADMHLTPIATERRPQAGVREPPLKHSLSMAFSPHGILSAWHSLRMAFSPHGFSHHLTTGCILPPWALNHRETGTEPRPMYLLSILATPIPHRPLPWVPPLQHALGSWLMIQNMLMTLSLGLLALSRCPRRNCFPSLPFSVRRDMLSMR